MKAYSDIKISHLLFPTHLAPYPYFQDANVKSEVYFVNIVKSQLLIEQRAHCNVGGSGNSKLKIQLFVSQSKPKQW
jgi:hypothetical protein